MSYHGVVEGFHVFCVDRGEALFYIATQSPAGQSIACERNLDALTKRLALSRNNEWLKPQPQEPPARSLTQEEAQSLRALKLFEGEDP